ncbi:MAG: helix-turn-helix transcriptional regulator [Deltaproteobacteria bacterium]|nr:helix-turn-helix transcriptional regulator [Myxococcales bacterium]MDP3214361.1 helix-turn-helix transcriptional regulator [Deltaproteobacteria bacterium]
MRRRPSARDPLYQAPEYLSLVGRIATNVRRLRETRGWNQEEAAHQCRDMAVLVYASIERAENNLTAVTLARLAIGFGVDSQELLEPAPPPTPRPPGRPRKVPVTSAAGIEETASVSEPDTSE